MPMEAIFAQMITSLSNDRIRPTIFSHSRWPHQDPYVMCMSSFGKHTHASFSEGVFPRAYWRVYDAPHVFCFASSLQRVPWENICRNFGRGSLSFALCFLQVCGEPSLLNNGLWLSALDGLTFLHFGCKSRCARTTSAVLSQPQLFQTAWKLPIEQKD